MIRASEVTSEFGACPWCARPISVTYRPSDMQPTSVLHDMPMCPEYARVEPGDYLKAVLDVRQGVSE